MKSMFLTLAAVVGIALGAASITAAHADASFSSNPTSAPQANANQ